MSNVPMQVQLEA